MKIADRRSRIFCGIRRGRIKRLLRFLCYLLKIQKFIDKIHKTAKKYTTFCITFRMYDSSVYGEGKAYGRIINDWENDSACLGLISWPSINVVESIKTAVNKREIKRFVLDMIQRYKADCEED